MNLPWRAGNEITGPGIFVGDAQQTGLDEPIEQRTHRIEWQVGLVYHPIKRHRAMAVLVGPGDGEHHRQPIRRAE